MRNQLSKVASVLNPLPWLAELFGRPAGPHPGVQHRDALKNRPPLDDADFLTRVEAAPEHVPACLVARRTIGRYCGIDQTAVYPEDALSILQQVAELRGQTVDWLDQLMGTEEELGLFVSDDWREWERLWGQVWREDASKTVSDLVRTWAQFVATHGRVPDPRTTS
jgi:hypothetical protein